jgi:hypothetical protein
MQRILLGAMGENSCQRQQAADSILDQEMIKILGDAKTTMRKVQELRMVAMKL